MEWIPFLARIGLYAVLNYFALSWYMDASNVYENRFYLNIPVIRPPSQEIPHSPYALKYAYMSGKYMECRESQIVTIYKQHQDSKYSASSLVWLLFLSIVIPEISLFFYARYPISQCIAAFGIFGIVFVLACVKRTRLHHYLSKQAPLYLQVIHQCEYISRIDLNVDILNISTTDIESLETAYSELQAMVFLLKRASSIGTISLVCSGILNFFFIFWLF